MSSVKNLYPSPSLFLNLVISFGFLGVFLLLFFVAAAATVLLLSAGRSLLFFLN